MPIHITNVGLPIQGLESQPIQLYLIIKKDRPSLHILMDRANGKWPTSHILMASDQPGFPTVGEWYSWDLVEISWGYTSRWSRNMKFWIRNWNDIQIPIVGEWDFWDLVEINKWHTLKLSGETMWKYLWCLEVTTSLELKHEFPDSREIRWLTLALKLQGWSPKQTS